MLTTFFKLFLTISAALTTRHQFPAPRGYVVISLGRESYKAHRLAWLVTYGEWPDEDIDHVDRDKSNNKIVNLRKASRSMNCANVGLRSHNTSGYRGVSFNAQWGRWFAQIIVGGEKRFLGYFESAEKASEAYVLAAKEAFGEYFPFLSPLYGY